MQAGFERFLVEDVILTLGNVRLAFNWVRQAGPGADPEAICERLDRLDRLLDVIEVRARNVCQELHAAGGELYRTGSEPEGEHVPIETAILDALAGTGDVPLFRSQRLPTPHGLSQKMKRDIGKALPPISDP